MRKSRLVSKISNTYFNDSLDLRVQSFNLLAFAGMAAGVIVTVLSIVINAGAANMIINSAASVLAFILLQVAGKKFSYHFCSWIIIFAVFIFAFPVLFFTAGGYRSGTPSFFIFAIIFTAILLDKRERTATLAFEVILYAACCFIAYYYPETVSPFQTEFEYVCDIVTGIVISGGLLLSVVLLHIRIHNIRQVQLDELNRELIARNETLTRYDSMKSDFLGTVAHEIKTPLTVIMSSGRDTLDLLEETPLNVTEIADNQRRIEKTVKKIDSIVLDLMDTAAIENGRISLNRLPVNLSELLQNICDTGFKQLDMNSNQVVYDFQPGLPLAWIDPARIEQVIINLLSNASRHTKNGVITVKLTGKNKTQTITITDNGMGMDAEMARIALKQYVSSEPDYWRRGIGLYICRRIILAHGGEIGIDSVKGQGTSVFFSLNEEALI